VLIVFGGLPGAGKTTLSRETARQLGGLWLRIDLIETSLVRCGLAAGSDTVGPAGYAVAHDLAEVHLALGRLVVIDAVNPVEAVRGMWRDLAARHAAPLRVIEVVCGDAGEHRRRVEARVADIAGHELPSWQDVLDREYEPWGEPRLTLDSAASAPQILVSEIIAYVDRPV
jgi:predicted kinase